MFAAPKGGLASGSKEMLKLSNAIGEELKIRSQGFALGFGVQ